MTADYLKSESLNALLRDIDVRKEQLDECRDSINSLIVDALNIEYTYDSNRIVFFSLQYMYKQCGYPA